MSGQSRSQASRAVRLIVFLAVFLSLLAPAAGSAAQAPEASPVVDPTATPSPEATVEPTATAEPSVTPTVTTEPTAISESTPTAESEFSAAAIASATFLDSAYTIGSGGATVVAIRVFTAGPTQQGFSLSSSGVVTFEQMVPINFGTNCVPTQQGESVIEGTIEAPDGNWSCILQLNVRVDSSIPAGTEGTIRFSTGPVGGPYTESDSASVRVVAIPVIAVSLSNETPGNDDIVTVTAEMTIDTTTSETISATVLVSLPNGATLISDSATATCTPACADLPLIDETPPTVRAIVNIPASASAPLTARLEFEVRINTETPPGSILSFESVGSADGANATPASASLTVTMAPTLELYSGVIAASPGDVVDVFAILRNPSSPGTISREEISVALPDGLTYVADSGYMDCIPVVCIDLADPTGTDPIVGFGDYPAGTVGPLITSVYFTVTVDPNATIGTMMTLTGTASSAGVPSNTATAIIEIVEPPDAPELAVVLSDSNPSRGDIIDVTVTLTSSTDAIWTSREKFEANLPQGTELVWGSQTVVCNPNVCFGGSNDGGTLYVRMYRDYPSDTTTPFTTTFTYKLKILDTAAMGVPLAIETTGESFNVPAPLVTTTLEVQPDTDVVATDGALEVPFGAGKNAQLVATGGTGAYEFTMDTEATKGIASVGEDGNYSYIAFIGETGADQFTYTVTDGYSTDTGTVTITILDPTPVVAGDQTLEVPFEGDGSGTLTATGGEDLLVFELDSQAGKGIATINPDGSFTYTANNGQTGTDQFIFTVTDTNTTDTGTVSVTIGAPDALVAESLTVTIDSSGVTSGNLADQVSGGIPPYTFLLVAAPTKGQVTISPEGLFTYIANEGAGGPDSFTYTVTDSQTAPTAAAVVTGTVNIILPAAPTPTPTQPVLTPIPTDEVTPTPTSTLEPGVTPTATSDDGNPGPGDPGDPGDGDPTATSVPGGDPDDGNDDGQTDGDDPITELPSTGTGESGTSPILLPMLVAGLAFLATAAILTARRRTH